MEMQNRVVLVAGATGELGRVVVRHFLDRGATVGALYRDAAASPGTSAAAARPETATPAERPAVLPAHERLIPLVADATNPAEVASAVERLRATAGPIDVLANTVGGYAGGRLLDTSDEAWRRQLDLNLTSAFVLSRAVLPHFLERGAGRIVHVASKAGAEPFAGALGYVVSKAGLLALVRALAKELDGTGVTVNAILPGTIDTEPNRRDMPKADRTRWVPPGEIARLIERLAAGDTPHLNGALVPIG
jgi:NAD(P)-dependent dehydrogenase (short-subunit alcohol dehydrogenase family)